jgi:serine/threonine protein kinase
VVRVLARDGWMETFEAYQPIDGGERRVVLQRVLAEHQAEPNLHRAFIEEMANVSRIQHAGLVPMIDHGVIDGLPFVVQEAVEGIALHDLGERARDARSPPPAEAALQIAADLAYALYHLHQVRDTAGRPIGMVHGEVNGNSALLAWAGMAKLGGLAMGRLRQRVEAAGAQIAVGPGAIRPPEQLLGEGVDARADIFGLGCLMHFLLVGSHPVVSNELSRTEVDTSIDDDLQQIIGRAAHPVRTQRYASAAQVAEDLALALRRRNRTEARAAVREWAASLRPTEIDTSRPRRGDLFVIESAAGVPDPAEGSLQRFQSALAPDAGLFSSELGSSALILQPDADIPDPSRTPADPMLSDAFNDTLPPSAGIRSPLIAPVQEAPRAPVVSSSPPMEAPPRVAARGSGEMPKLVAPAVPSASQAAPAGDPRIGTILHGYRLIERIGEGSVAKVYRAVHQVLPRECAVKVLDPAQAQFELSAARLKREALLLCELQHPNLVSVLDFGITADGAPFLMLELLRGQTLRDRLERQGRMAPELAKEITRQIAAGLTAAHDKGLVHRDLKPSNVMLLEESGYLRVKLLDFGLARITEDHATRLPTTLTSPRAFLGTPKYIAPEQITGASSTGPSADLYSLGVILHHMLSGAAPYNGSVIEIVNGQLYHPPPPLPPSAGMERIAVWLMDKDPAQRPESAAALVDALRQLEPPAPPEPVTEATPAAIAPSGDARTLIVVLSVLLLLLVFAAIALKLRPPAVDAPIASPLDESAGP